MSQLRSMSGVKLMEMKSTKDRMQMLDLKETTDQLERANSVRQYGDILRNDENNFLRRVFDLTVKGTEIEGRPNKTRLNAVEEQI